MLIAQFHQLCLNQINNLYGTIHFDNTIDRSIFPPEFHQLDAEVHQIALLLTVTLNEPGHIEDLSTIIDIHHNQLNVQN